MLEFNIIWVTIGLLSFAVEGEGETSSSAPEIFELLSVMVGVGNLFQPPASDMARDKVGGAMDANVTFVQ